MPITMYSHYQSTMCLFEMHVQSLAISRPLPTTGLCLRANQLQVNQQTLRPTTDTHTHPSHPVLSRPPVSRASSQQIHRTRAESQWIVATKATLPLTIPRSNSSRLHAIHFIWVAIAFGEAPSVCLRTRVNPGPATRTVSLQTKRHRRVLAWILT